MLKVVGRSYSTPLILLVCLFLSACFDDLPIRGKWRAQGLFGLSAQVEFQPDRVIAGNQSQAASYEVNGQEITVILDGRERMAVTVLAPDRIRMQGMEWRRMEEGSAGDLLGLGELPLPDLSLFDVFGDLLALFDLSPPGKPAQSPADSGSLFAELLGWLGIDAPKPAPAKQAAPSHTAPSKTGPSTAAAPRNPATASQTAPSRPAPVRRPAPEAVQDRAAVVEGSYRALAGYQAAQIKPLSKDFLRDWFGLQNCRLLQRDRNDEFAMAEHIAGARSEIEAIPPVKRVRVAMTVDLGEYDFDKQTFALPAMQEGKAVTVQSSGSCMYVSLGGEGGLPYQFTVQLDSDAPWPASLPMPQAEARELVQGFKTRGYGGSRAVLVDLVVELMSADARGRIMVQPVAAYFWKENDRRHFLGALGHAAPGSETSPRQAAAAPASAPAASAKSPAAAAPAATPPAQTPSAQTPPAPTPSAPTSSATAAPSGTAAAVAPAAPQRVSGKARVVDTATLSIGGRNLALAGISGLRGAPVNELQSFLTAQGDHVDCAPAGAAYSCVTRNGVNVAEAALLNGAARTLADSSDRFRSLEQEAKTGRRGVWAK